MFVGSQAHSCMVFTSHKQLTHFLKNNGNPSKSIGFVPTMGALHQGHLALMHQALSDNDLLIVSIFVNPTQFNNQEDLHKYPRILEQDLALINASLPIDRIFVYAPDVNDVYGDHTVSKSYDFEGLEQVMEGAQRPGHFDGVGTILEFLFEVVQPDNAYFGEKDFQQLQIIKKLVEKLSLDINIIGCPIYREDSGLAMSSRNGRLTPENFKKAAQIYQVLLASKAIFKNHGIARATAHVEEQIAAMPGFELEYYTIACEKTLEPATMVEPGKKYRAFIVVHLQGVRLIDNISLD